LRIAHQLACLLALAVPLVTLGGWSSCRDSNASVPEPTSTASAAVEVKEVTLPGIDTSAMTPRERREFSSLVSDLLAPCANVPVSIAQCVLEKRACAGCMMAAKSIAHAVREGATDEQIQVAFKSRFDPAGMKVLPLAGSPSKGPDGAKVTIVEFADFECPHCRAAMPMVDAVLAAHPDKVRLVYKFVALPLHVRAEPAARAAWAAGQQGKFWEMEHLLFERQDHLEQGDLERYAHILKLDLAKWKVDMESPAAKDRLAQDRKLFEELKLEGTPSLFVDGRELDLGADEILEERVATELGISPESGGAPSAPPSAALPFPPSPPAVPSPSAASSGAPR
jgi:protein-disulfide isomerase